MPSTRADAISYVEKSDMHESDKVYWRGQQTPFQPELTLTLSHRASGFQTTDRTFAGVKARLYTKTSHAKTSLLVVIPGGPTKSGVDRDEDFAAQFGTDFIIFDVPPLEMGKRNGAQRYDQLAHAFKAFGDSDMKEPYKERKLLAASAGCFDGILLAFFVVSWKFPFTAVAAVVPVTTWDLDPKEVDGQKHAPGLGLDRMSEFCKPAMEQPERFDHSVPPNLCHWPVNNIARLPKMLFIISKHDVLYSPGLRFAKKVSDVTKNATIFLANAPHQVKDSAHFAAHNAVTTCIGKFLAGEEMGSFDPKLLDKVSG